MTIVEGCNVDDWLVNRELYLPAQLSLHHDRPIQWPHYCSRCTDPPVNLALHPSLTREQGSKILELLHLREELSSNPQGASHLFPVENHGPRVGGADFHPSCFILGCKLPQDMLSTLGLPVPISCHRSPPGQPGSVGLLLLPDSFPFFRCPPPGSGIAATTCTGDLMATASNSHVSNGSREYGPFGLNVPSGPRDLVKALLEVGVKDLPDRGFRQTLTIRLGLPSLSSFLPCQRIQLNTRWWSVDRLRAPTPGLWAPTSGVGPW